MAPKRKSFADTAVAKRRKTSTGRKKRASSRNIGVTFEVPEKKRGHVKEYGDPTVFPCGSRCIVDQHYRDCDECNAVRFIMDSWLKANQERTAHGESVVQPPALTFAAIEKVLNKMNISFNTINLQADTWNPYTPVCLAYDKELNEEDSSESDSDFDECSTSKTFAETWEELREKDHAFGIRGELPLPHGFCVETSTAATVPILHNAMNAGSQFSEYLIMTAVNDGVLSQDYINAVATNFGIVEKPKPVLRTDTIAERTQKEKDKRATKLTFGR